jgi:hypothetical protein
MKPFSLINSLQDSIRNAPVVKLPQYAVYILQVAESTERVGVPVANVDTFDAYLTENLDALADIDSLLQKFDAVRLED